MSEWPGTEIPHEQTWITTLVGTARGYDFHRAAAVARLLMQRHWPALDRLWVANRIKDQAG
jgi:hypothetical protein